MSGPAMLRIAALFNLAIGLAFLLGRAVVVPWAQLDAVSGSNVLITNLAALLIASFGLFYWVISTDVARYRPMLLVGLVGKLAAVLAAAQFVWAAHGAQWRAPALAGGDLVFVVLFYRLYISTGPARGAAGEGA